MGIYCVKSTTCNCKGTWSTLDPNDKRIYMSHPCKDHSLVEGNVIYYELQHYLQNLINNNIEGISFKDKYQVKILNINKLDKKNLLMKLELNHTGDLKPEYFDDKKKILNSDMNGNGEPILNKINDTTLHILILYQAPYHTVEKTWERFDY